MQPESFNTFLKQSVELKPLAEEFCKKIEEIRGQENNYRLVPPLIIIAVSMLSSGTKDQECLATMKRIWQIIDEVNKEQNPMPID